MPPQTPSLGSRASGLTVGTAVVVGLCLYEVLADLLNAELEEDLFPTVLSVVDRFEPSRLVAVPARHAGKAVMWGALGLGAVAVQLAARRKASR